MKTLQNPVILEVICVDFGVCFFFSLTMACFCLTLNCNGLRDEGKRRGLLQWLSPLNPSFICLQETHAVSDVEIASWFLPFGHLLLASHHSRKSAGVAIFASRSSPVSVVQKWRDSDGRFACVQVDFRGAVFRIASIYAPNRNPARDAFYDGISPLLDPIVPNIVAGDFNSVADLARDRRGGNPSEHYDSVVRLRRLAHVSSSVDIWRALHPDDQAFTWSNPLSTISSRIDRIYCPISWLSNISSSRIIPCPFTDHCAVVFSISDIPSALAIGPGYWKLNCFYLNDVALRLKIASFWSSWRNQKFFFSSPLSWWDVGKAHIKAICIEHCQLLNKVKREERQRISDELLGLKSYVDRGQLSYLSRYKELLALVKEYDAQRARAAKIRARVRWAEEGETSSSYFCRLERKRAADRLIYSVDVLPRPTSTSLESLEAFREFYQELFTSTRTFSSDREEMIDNISKSLSPDERDLCEGPLSGEECLTALKGMVRGSSPGIDGFPMEFYVAFWDILGEDLVAVLNHAHCCGYMSPSQCRGLITLIHKGGERSKRTNWRPISLLNVDYKIASRAIALRLLKVIGSVVTIDQTCGVPGRFIGDNTALLRDLASYCTQSSSPAAILFLDQQKAFDRVEWRFLTATLHKMGFGASFLQWIGTFYARPQSAVYVNQFTSSFFPLTRGVRQGCPLSPLLYVIVAEVLASSLRCHPGVRGVRIPGTSDRAVVSQYADDTAVIVSDNPSIAQVFQIYRKYELASGAKINLDKCSGLWLGPWVGRVDFPFRIRWCSNFCKSLGIFVGNDDTEHENFDQRITRLHNVFLSWRQRGLSLVGKAFVTNSLALSGLFYVAGSVPVPEWVVSSVSRLCWDFLWRGKTPLVARSTCVQPRGKGGLFFPHFEYRVSAFHGCWVRRFLFDSGAKWKLFFSHWLQRCLPPGIGDIALFDLGCLDLSFFPPFYQSILQAWRRLGGCGNPRDNSYTVYRSDHPASDMTVKASYAFLLEQSLATPHCVEKWRPTYGTLYWESTWSQLSFSNFQRNAVDLSWKIAHGVLYTVDRLASFGYSGLKDCFCGQAGESLEHLFYSCPLAQSVLGWVSVIFFTAVPDCPSLRARHILFGFNALELEIVPKIFSVILILFKWSVWLARNDYHFRGCRPCVDGVIASLKANICFSIRCHFRKMSGKDRRAFLKHWAANGLLASVHGDSLVLKI